MLRIGICDDVYDARLVLRSALERVLERAAGSRGSFSNSPPARGCSAGWNTTPGSWTWCFWTWRWGSWTAWRPPGGSGRRTAGSSWCSSPATPTTSLTGTAWGPWGICLKPPKPEQLEAVLDRAQAALYRDLDRAYVCRSGDTHYRIPMGNILVLRLRPAAGDLRHRGAGLHLLRQAGRRGGGGGGRLCPRPPAVSGPGGGRGPGGGQRGGADRTVPRLPISRSCLSGGPAGPDPGGTGGVEPWENGSLEFLRQLLCGVAPGTCWPCSTAMSSTGSAAPFRPAAEKMVVAGRSAASLDPGGQQRHGDLGGGPQPALYAAGLLWRYSSCATRGDRVGRLAMCLILFCLEMSVCALLDTYCGANQHGCTL